MLDPAVSTQRFSTRPPTKRQLEILGFIAARIDCVGYPPTFREIGAAFRYRSCAQVVTDLLGSLESKGLLTRSVMKSRGLRVTDLGRKALAGRIVFVAPERRCSACDLSVFSPVCGYCGDPAPVREAA